MDDHLSHVTSRPTRDLHYYGNISLILLRALMYRTGCPLRLSEVHNSEASSHRSCPPYCEDRWLVGASQERRRVSDFTSSKHHNHTLHTAHRGPACLGGNQSSHQLLTHIIIVTRWRPQLAWPVLCKREMGMRLPTSLTSRSLPRLRKTTGSKGRRTMLRTAEEASLVVRVATRETRF